MQIRKSIHFLVILMFTVSIILFNSFNVYADSHLLKTGMKGENVSELQKDLKKLGFLGVDPTGYYGSLTTVAITKLQLHYGFNADGIAGEKTLGLIDKLLGKTFVTSRGNTDSSNILMPWFGGVENFFAMGDKATVFDIDTGLTFRIERTYGYNHADCETLTSKDTAIMKKIYGGQWSWDRRAIIVTVNGRSIAASMAGMPHAGNDSATANSSVTWRSGGYGAGTNLDTVKGNNMDGHFDVHFLGSKTHGTNSVDPNHQNMVNKAAKWAQENL